MKPKKHLTFVLFLSIFLLLLLSSCNPAPVANNAVAQNPIRVFVNKTIDEPLKGDSSEENETVEFCNKTILQNVTKTIQKSITVNRCNITNYNFSIKAGYGKWFKKQELQSNDFRWYYVRNFDVFNPYDKIMVLEMCIKFYKHVWQNYSKEIEQPVCFIKDIYPKGSAGVSYEWYVDKDDDKFYNLTLVRVLDFNESYDYFKEKINRANAGEDVVLEPSKNIVERLGGCFAGQFNKTINETVVVEELVNITVPCSELNSTE